MINILYWSQISSQENTTIPIFFFYPTLDFLNFINQFGSSDIPIYITGNDLYSGLCYGCCDKTAPLGNCLYDQPSFDKQTYVFYITNRDFTAYPQNAGSFEIAAHI